MRSPLVTIGVPIYNGGRYVGEALAAVAAQTYPEIEIVISDNASTDDTEAICLAFIANRPNVRYFRQPSNIGMLANFDFVMRVASGEYFLWFAADDGCAPEFVGRLVEAFETRPDHALIGSDVCVIDSAGKPLRIERLESVRPGARDWQSVQSGFWRYYIDNRYLLIYGMYRSALLRRCSVDCFGAFRGVASMEIPFLAQVTALGKAAALPDPLKYYRVHDASAYQSEKGVQSAGWLLSNYLNVWMCLWRVSFRHRLPIRFVSHQLATFPFYLARFAKRKLSAMIEKSHGSKGSL